MCVSMTLTTPAITTGGTTTAQFTTDGSVIESSTSASHKEQSELGYFLVCVIKLPLRCRRVLDKNVNAIFKAMRQLLLYLVYLYGHIALCR